MDGMTAQDWVVWGAARRDSLELERYLTSSPKRTEPEPFKRCGCCGKCYSAETWKSLAYGGVQPSDVAPLEYRHCGCGSTIAVVMAVES